MLTQSQIAEIISLRQNENYTLAQIGKEFGLSSERVRQILKARGITTHRPRKVEIPTKRTSSRYDWDEIVFLHTIKQLSSYDIAAAVGGNPTYIRQVLADRGVLRSQKEAASLKIRQRKEVLLAS